MSRRRHLTCTCCGSSAGNFEQFWNQDNGYGMCGDCIDWELDRGTSQDELKLRYGEPVVNFELTQKWRDHERTAKAEAPPTVSP